jgi:hypothetical protein
MELCGLIATMLLSFDSLDVIDNKTIRNTIKNKLDFIKSTLIKQREQVI